MTVLVRHRLEVATLMGNRRWLLFLLFLSPFLLVLDTLHRFFGVFEDEVTVLIALHLEVAVFLWGFFLRGRRSKRGRWLTDGSRLLGRLGSIALLLLSLLVLLLLLLLLLLLSHFLLFKTLFSRCRIHQLNIVATRIAF